MSDRGGIGKELRAPFVERADEHDRTHFGASVYIPSLHRLDRSSPELRRRIAQLDESFPFECFAKAPVVRVRPGNGEAA